MVINVMNYLTLILLVLALCVLFPTNIQATNSLSEKFSKCEKEFWFKNLSHYKQSLKSKCLKEKHHQKEKRHRQKHACNNKSLDKKIILSKWEKFSNCRCESAIEEELKDTKESKVLTCYQIAKFNKVSGKFVGQLSVFKKNSDKHDFDVAIKFSDVKLLNNKGNWVKNKEGYYRSKKSTQTCKDQFTVDTYFIKGEISQKESMNKISLNRISPSNIKIIDKNSEESTTLPNSQQVLIPFPKFVLKEDNNNEKTPEKNPKNSEDPKKSPTDVDSPPVDPAGPSSPPSDPSPNNPPSSPKPSDPSSNNPVNPPSESDPSTTSPTSPPASDDDTNTPGDNTNTPGGNTNTPGGNTNTPGDNTNTPSGSVNTPGGNTNTPTDNKNSIPTNDESSANAVASPADKSVTSSNQEASVNQQGAPPFTGLLVFGVIVSVGAAFVGYNTYERIKWRRHFRRGQAAAAQLNPSLANVPDYNGYGRAY